MSSNLGQLLPQLAKFEDGAPEKFLQFFADSAGIYQLSRRYFIEKNFDSFGDFVSLSAMSTLLRKGSLKKLYNFVSHYFNDEHLRILFSFQSMYLGVSPYDAPAIYSVIPYVETALGVWYPQGGMYALVEAITKLAQDLGVTIHTSTPVKRIISANGRIYGIEIGKGIVKKADLVIANADLTYSYNELLTPEQHPHFSLKKINHLKHSGSALLYYFGVKNDCTKLLHHNVYISADFKKNLNELFHYQSLPQDPSFYIYVPTKTDSSLAPDGHHAVYVLVPVPNTQSNIDWDEAQVVIRKKIIRVMKKEFALDIVRDQVTERHFSPVDFFNKYNLPYGAAFGLSHYFFQSAYFRPANYSKDINGLYFVGASTYPGGGVPMVLISAKLVTERILDEQFNSNSSRR